MSKPREKNKDTNNDTPASINIGDTETSPSIQEAEKSYQRVNNSEKKPTIIKSVTNFFMLSNNQAKIANIISAGMLFATVILAVCTLNVFNQTTIQTAQSIKSANAAKISADAAKRSADLQKQALDSQISAKTQSDIADAKKLKRDTDFVNYQKKGIDSQINSMRQNQKEFEIANQPYLEFMPDTSKAELKGDEIIRFYFKISPLSTRVIEGQKTSFQIVAWFGDSTKFMKEAFVNPKYVNPMKDNTYYTQIDPNRRQIAFYDKTDSVRRSFLNGKCIFFIVGRVEYINYINQKMRFYDFIIAIRKANKLVTYNYEINHNYDIKK